MQDLSHTLRAPLRRALTVFALVLAALAPAPLAAQAAPAPSAGAAPGSELDVFLVTMGQGDMVWEKFGHNAIWIHDPVAGTDYVYNYGLFDFNSPGYWQRFLKGNWLYELGVSDIDRTMYQYRHFNRSVQAQELNLTPAQKAELQAFLEWNARPENREYLYDYYRDNCSTRIRDVIDRVIGGRLRAATMGEPTGTTYRWHSERLIAEDRPAYFGLLGGLGPAADRPIDAWEEMFLPGKVQEQVRTVRVPDESGRMVPLVAAEHTLFTAVGREPERAEPPFWLPWYLLAGLALGGALAGLGSAARRSRAARAGFAALGGFWSLVSGVGGALLLALWTLTNHQIAYRNENLFQFDPLSLALVVLVPALALGARWAARPARVLALTVAALSVAGFVLQALPGLDQVNGTMIAFTLPVHLGLAWGVDRLARNGREREQGTATREEPAAAGSAERRRQAVAG
ncbi:MAG TPA: DUF4105 domain-containing protein [Longimicrobiaceae bacterium]|nr:DUF4105 domain-containing protein [Longimicrobiaceae bacterium]